MDRAIDAARAADVAVVFVNDIRTEGADLPTLKLPGDQDALIRAVAAANPRTVVVLDGRLHVRSNARGVRVRIRVRNTGARAGAEVVQLYVGFPPSADEPPKVLKAFRKVQLAPGQRAAVSLRLNRRDLSVWSDARSRWVSPAGRYRLMAGSSSRDIHATASFFRRGS